MRNIIVTEYLTLDGVFEEPGHWSFAYWNEESMLYKRDELFSSDVQLLGRVTYEGFAKAWPTMPDTGDFGERMNSMPKLVHTLMQHNLVDEYRFMVHPVVLGSGKRLFTEGTEKFKLTLVETKAFKTGIVVLHYQPDRDSKDK